MEGFKQVRESLIDMLEELDERLENITHSDIKHLDESIDKYLDTSNDDIAPPQEGKIKIADDEIEKIKQAISQIDEGCYGICLECGKAIKKEQLEIYPLSQTCVCCGNNNNTL
jgi:RNA polymerase-binding transcription factor DksA